MSGQTPFFGTKQHLFEAIVRGSYSVSLCFFGLEGGGGGECRINRKGGKGDNGEN